MRKSFEGHDVAVTHRIADRFRKGSDCSQLTILPRARKVQLPGARDITQLASLEPTQIPKDPFQGRFIVTS
jgi:hypothetical protein